MRKRRNKEEESNIYKTLNVKETSIDKLYQKVKQSFKEFPMQKSLLNYVITL